MNSRHNTCARQQPKFTRAQGIFATKSGTENDDYYQYKYTRAVEKQIFPTKK